MKWAVAPKGGRPPGPQRSGSLVCRFQCTSMRWWSKSSRDGPLHEFLKQTAVRGAPAGGRRCRSRFSQVLPARSSPRFAALKLLTAFRRLAALQARRRRTDQGSALKVGTIPRKQCLRLYRAKQGLSAGWGYGAGGSAGSAPQLPAGRRAHHGGGPDAVSRSRQ
jgi:hypothetical protein